MLRADQMLVDYEKFIKFVQDPCQRLTAYRYIPYNINEKKNQQQQHQKMNFSLISSSSNRIKHRRDRRKTRPREAPRARAQQRLLYGLQVLQVSFNNNNNNNVLFHSIFNLHCTKKSTNREAIGEHPTCTLHLFKRLVRAKFGVAQIDELQLDRLLAFVDSQHHFKSTFQQKQAVRWPLFFTKFATVE